MGLTPVRTLDDIVALGKEVVARDYTALKTVDAGVALMGVAVAEASLRPF